MKRSLMFAAAVSAFVVPAAAPLTASAQDAPLFRSREDVRAARRAEDEASRPAPAPAAPREDRSERREERRAERPAPPANEDRQDRRENRQERWEARADDAPSTPQDRTADRQDRRQNRQESLEERAQRRPDQPLYRNRQDVLDARAAEARGETWRPRTERQARRDDRREDRQDRREYREFRQRFNSDQWHHDYGRRYNSGWWRNDRRFRGFNGVRVGFYFAPSYGYYQVPRQYWGQRYYEGQFLPSIFWRYQLDDWRTYGLGYPPEGTRWVLVDNQIYLIDERDGYIIDVVRDAWNW